MDQSVWKEKFIKPVDRQISETTFWDIENRRLR